jgi:8-oxo-dGTP pyrophosphatase MutT (NUDIX family)
MRRWQVERADTLFDHRLFRLERHRLVADESAREALVLQAPDWVNVIALLPDSSVVFVRQWRFGLAAVTLEIPGGMVDPGEAPIDAAARELVEETGYRAGTIELLGEVHPNPAFISNRCLSYLARDLAWIGEPQGDGEEELTVETAPLAAVPDLVARGVVTHSLVISAFYHLMLRERGAGSAG